jgi:hypothetical protein
MHPKDKSGGESRTPSSEPRVVPFVLPDAQRKALRSYLNSALHGILGDLRTPHALRDPSDTAREGEVTRRMLEALDQGEITVPDEEARERIERIAHGFDEAEEYDVVSTLHDAHQALVRVLGGEEVPVAEEGHDEDMPTGNPGPAWLVDDPDDCPREVLDLLLREAPDCLAFSEVASVLAGDPDDWAERDALRNAITGLIAGGLVRRNGGVLAPSRPARQMAGLGFHIG